MEEKLKSVFSNLFTIKDADFNDGLSMSMVDGWDSLKHMELIVTIENEFGIPKLEMDEIVEMTSIAKIKEVLQGKGVEF